MKKKFTYDGKSRPTTDLYKKNFDRIFGVKEEEEDPFKKEVDELNESYEQSKKSKKERQKEIDKLDQRNGF